MGDNIKIAAVVVTYNRLDLMKKCVNALRKQSRILNTIFVINVRQEVVQVIVQHDV